jgi:hypothetical protein
LGRDFPARQSDSAECSFAFLVQSAERDFVIFASSTRLPAGALVIPAGCVDAVRVISPCDCISAKARTDSSQNYGAAATRIAQEMVNADAVELELAATALSFPKIIS